MSPDPNDAVAADNLSVQQNPGSKKAGWVFGGGLLLVLVALILLLPNPTDRQCVIIRFLMATAIAFLSVLLIGGITIKGTISKLSIQAAGGLGIFVLMMTVIDPFQLQTAVADAAPSLIPASEDVRDAQRVLQARDAYDGPINGRLTSKTREAIRDVQTMNNLEVDGRLDTQTKRLIIRRQPQPPDN